MILSELKDQVDFLISNGHGNDTVLVTLSESSVGARASTGIIGLYPGFDWERGQVRISTEKKVISYGKDRDKEMLPRRKDYDVGTRIRHLILCPKCENQLRKDDNYCSQCGQRIKKEIKAIFNCKKIEIVSKS